MEVRVEMELRVDLPEMGSREQMISMVWELLLEHRHLPASEVLRGLRIVDVAAEEPWDRGSWDGKEVWE